MDNDLLDTNKIEFETNTRQTISEVVNDIKVTNYKKLKETFVSINSKDRDEKDNKPNNYLVNLNNKFDNIESISLEQVEFPYSITPINITNNKIRWTYATEEEFSDCSQLKFKNNTFKNNFYADSSYVYEAEIEAGFYDTETLSQALMESMNQIEINNIYRDNIPDVVTNGQKIYDGETISSVQGKNHNFYIDINPITNETLFINRLENFVPVTIETCIKTQSILSNPTKQIDFASLNIDDVLGYFFSFNEVHVSTTNDALHSDNSIYFTLPVFLVDYTDPSIPGFANKSSPDEHWEVYNQQLEDFRWGNSGLPIIPTNFPSIGGYTAEMINNKEYYYVDKKPNNWEGGTYEFVDKLTYFTGQSAPFTVAFEISQTKTKVFLYRFKLNLIKNGNNINCRNRELFILNDKIEYTKYYKQNGIFPLNKAFLFSDYLLLSQVIGENIPIDRISKKLPRIGRGMPFKLDVENSTILPILAWSIPNCNLITISDKCNYRAIQYNTDTYLTNKIDYYTNGIINKYFPTLDIEFLTSGLYVFRGQRYVFMKLIFPTYGDISTNLSKTVHENSDLSVTSNNNLFSKIMLPVIPSTLKSNQFVSYEYRPFEDVLDNISSIIIQFLDSDGKIIDMNTEHNFTLKIVERQNVLKNTLLNTRTNQINTTGIFDKC